MDISKELLDLLLPDFIVEHFTFIKSTSSEEHLHIYFEEISTVPVEFMSRNIESKGFHNEIIIEDFPLRGKLVYLHVKRRRWRDVETRETLQRDWNSVAKGTRRTEDFALFLKEINR